MTQHPQCPYCAYALPPLGTVGCTECGRQLDVSPTDPRTGIRNNIATSFLVLAVLIVVPDCVAIVVRLVSGASIGSSLLALWVIGYLIIDGLVIVGAVWLLRVLWTNCQTGIHSRRVQRLVLYTMWTMLFVNKVVPMWIAAF